MSLSACWVETNGPLKEFRWRDQLAKKKPTLETVRTYGDYPEGPVRKILTGRHTRSCAGDYPSKKNGVLVPFESLLEGDLVVIMEKDLEIARYWAQPETFRWRDEAGRRRRYTPDFLVLKVDGTRVYREVKLKKQRKRDPDLGGRLPRIKQECATRGAQFEFWTEDEIRIRTNAS